MLAGWFVRRLAWGVIPTLLLWLVGLTLLYPILSSIDWVAGKIGIGAAFVYIVLLGLLWVFVQLSLTVLVFVVIGRTLKRNWNERRS